ncbi:MAG: pyrroloquinoline quinone biosynthesis protein PqqE [Polyangiaceae bacterium]|jgi:pyrroloquinoline quinone biosynthesis protein E
MNDAASRPYTLIAELTYRCPLRCAYCANPIDFASRVERLDAACWQRVFAEAESLGVLQVHLTGGEPLVRSDLERLVAAARKLDLYTNVISSGVPADRERIFGLKDAGLDAFQLSIQDVDASAARAVTGGDWLDHKIRVAGWLREAELPITLNVVLHRGNMDRVADMVALAERLGAHRLELANTQYLSWALLNRSALLPSRAQIDRARAVAQAARIRTRGSMEIVFVLPDYYAQTPKACMDGWGRRTIVVTPDGLALPCHLAHTLPGLRFESVLDRSLVDLWQHGEGFESFRGEAWMGEPCRSCEHRTVDFGGCRCQAYHLTGEASATDPACALAPAHSIIEKARSVVEAAHVDADVPPAFVYRSIQASRTR